MSFSRSNTHKRKGSDVVAGAFGSSTRSVVVQPVNSGSSWATTRSKLASYRETLEADQDPVWSILQRNLTHNDEAESTKATMMKDADETLKKLEAAVEQAAEHCKEESAAVHEMQQALKKLAAERDNVLHYLSLTDTQIENINKEIMRYQTEADQEIGAIDSVEEERKTSVPRLKYLISLYAMCTGIKWDFDEERILTGSVVRVSLCRPCDFESL